MIKSTIIKLKKKNKLKPLEKASEIFERYCS